MNVKKEHMVKNLINALDWAKGKLEGLDTPKVIPEGMSGNPDLPVNVGDRYVFWNLIQDEQDLSEYNGACVTVIGKHHQIRGKHGFTWDVITDTHKIITVWTEELFNL